MRPQNLWAHGEPDAVSLSYMEAIAQAHGFEQGNKRTGFDAGFLFLNANGWDLHPGADNELLAVAFIEVIEHTRPIEDFDAYLADYVVPALHMSSDELNEAIDEIAAILQQDLDDL